MPPRWTAGRAVTADLLSATCRHGRGGRRGPVPRGRRVSMPLRSAAVHGAAGLCRECNGHVEHGVPSLMATGPGLGPDRLQAATIYRHARRPTDG